MNAKLPATGQDYLPKICSYCQKVLNCSESQKDTGDSFQHSQVSHGICPDCLLEHFPVEYIKIQQEYRLRIKYSYRVAGESARQYLAK